MSRLYSKTGTGPTGLDLKQPTTAPQAVTFSIRCTKGTFTFVSRGSVVFGGGCSNTQLASATVPIRQLKLNEVTLTVEGDVSWQVIADARN